MWLQLDPERLATLKRVINGDPVHHEDRMGLADLIAQKEASSGDPRYLAYAQENAQSDGDIEFDDDAVISEGSDPGAYVMGWKWIGASDAGVPINEEDGEE